MFSPFIYTCSKTLLLLFFKLYNRVEFFGQENIPPSGAMILAPNHTSHLDPPVVGLGVPRYLKFLAKKELFSPPLGWWIKAVGGQSVNRQRGAIKALRMAEELLKNEQAIVVFPEGTRSLDGKVQAAKPGLAMLALRTNAPVIPTYIEGTFQAFPKGAKFPKPSKIRVFYGEPIIPDMVIKNIDDKAAYKEFSSLIMQKICQLIPN